MTREICGLELLLELQVIEPTIRVRVTKIIALIYVDGQGRPGIKDVVDAKREGRIGQPITPTPF